MIIITLVPFEQTHVVPNQDLQPLSDELHHLISFKSLVRIGMSRIKNNLETIIEVPYKRT
jgi:hypothetical protein